MMCTAEKTYHTYFYIMQNTNNILLESRRSSSGVGGEGGVGGTLPLDPPLRVSL